MKEKGVRGTKNDRGATERGEGHQIEVRITSRFQRGGRRGIGPTGIQHRELGAP